MQVVYMKCFKVDHRVLRCFQWIEAELYCGVVARLCETSELTMTRRDDRFLCFFTPSSDGSQSRGYNKSATLKPDEYHSTNRSH